MGMAFASGRVIGRRIQRAISRVILSFVIGSFLQQTPASAQQLPLVVQVTTEKGTNPIYRPGQLLHVTVRTNREAYVQCYYVAADGSVALVFPNPDQSDNRIAGGAPIVVPPVEGDFKIRLVKELSFETISCFGTLDDTRDWIPAAFSKPLEVIPNISYADLEAQLLTRRPRNEISLGSVTVVVSQ